jgi:hypothetical protein
MSINPATAEIQYIDYTDEAMMPDIQRLVSKDLSEPYSVFTYRYFLHNCPRYCICAYAIGDDGVREMMATIVCKLEGEGEAMQVQRVQRAQRAQRAHTYILHRQHTHVHIIHYIRSVSAHTVYQLHNRYILHVHNMQYHTIKLPHYHTTYLPTYPPPP